MIIRKDSVFHGITEEDMERFLTWMEEPDRGKNALPPEDEVAEFWEEKTKRETTGAQVKRFVARLKLDRMLKEGAEELEGLADRAKSGKSRDGLIEAARQKLLEEAMEKDDSKLLLELYRSSHEERAREREVEVARRKAAAAEENARTGRLRVELDAARSVMKMLPNLQALLTDASVPAEERIARALRCLPERRGPLLLEAPKGNGVVAEESSNDKIQMPKE
jgi:hypothetical protein